MDVKSAAGDLHAVHLSGDVRIQTAAGSVRIDALDAGTIRIDSTVADLEIGVVAGLAVRLDLQTGRGIVDCELDRLPNEPTDDCARVDLRAHSATGRVHVYRSAV